VKKPEYPHPVIDLKETKKEPYIMVSPEQRIRQITDSVLKKAGIKNPTILFTLKNYKTAQLLAESNLGITLIPTEYAKLSLISSPRCLSIESKYQAYWDMCITTVKGAYLTKAAETFLAHVKQKFTS
jgi:DNA-binding transcriptional LysR family regulator